MNRQLPSYVGLVVLFAVSFVVYQSVYGYVIAFQSDTNDCFFVFGRPFLREFLDHPAGALRYAGRFLGQLYHYRWLGALVVSASITCFGFLFHRVLVTLEQTRALYGGTHMFYYFFVTTPRQPRRITGAGGGFGGTTRVE